jgi:putative hydrolase of the HAD superfamily
VKHEGLLKSAKTGFFHDCSYWHYLDIKLFQMRMPKPSHIQAITLDLDDTLWPVAPTIKGAEQDLLHWLLVNTPKTAHLSQKAEVKDAIRQSMLAKHSSKVHDLGFLRREVIRETMRQAGDDPQLANEAYAVFDTARQRVTLYEGVKEALARLSTKFRLVAISNGTADVFSRPLRPTFTRPSRLMKWVLPNRT